jgi:hypothetical protein
MKPRLLPAVDVERWLRAVPRANGTRAKIKCVMSAVFSHGVRWELAIQTQFPQACKLVPAGEGGQVSGVRVSSKRQKEPIVSRPFYQAEFWARNGFDILSNNQLNPDWTQIS